MNIHNHNHEEIILGAMEISNEDLSGIEALKKFFPIKDLDLKVEGNPVLHVFSKDISLCKFERIVDGRKKAVEITNECGEVGCIGSSTSYKNFESYETRFSYTSKYISCKDSCIMNDPSSSYELIRDTWGSKILVSLDKIGFRNAQKGALYAIFSHWTKSDRPATVVMPTGAGKTETILGIIASLSPKKTLVIVPSDVLRTQFADKATTWGKLKGEPIDCLGKNSRYPVVGIFKRGFKDIDKFENFLNLSHIVVATMPILAKLNSEQKDILVKKFDLVTIDEAHHVAAQTWKEVLSFFSEAKIVQFTATPFRSDGKHVDGDIIYSYPLQKCQEDGIFKPIRFFPVVEYHESRADKAIASKAISVLREDLALGKKHALMARAKSKKRAIEIYNHYLAMCPDLKPVLLYSGTDLSASERYGAKRDLLNGNSKVIVCVDMLGEGFDFPNLKISAIHDAHKSLPITLQFIGRFTRTSNDEIGDASFVANIADQKVQDNISSLYSQNSDWNGIIRNAYDDAIRSEVEFQDFVNNFHYDAIKGFSIRNICPKFSTFPYFVEGELSFKNLKKHFNDGKQYRLSINEKDSVAIVVEKRNDSVDWGNIIELENINYHCYVIWNCEELGLLFLYSSAKDVPENLIEAVCLNAKEVKGVNIFKCLSGIKRLMLNNVGLKKQLSGPIRYRQYLGPDVALGIKESTAGGAYTAMLYGVGYENAQKVAVGCSLKGKIWSKNAGSVLGWKNWCRELGLKLKDEGINIDSIFEGFLYPEEISELEEDWNVVAADWGDFLFENLYERIVVKIEDKEYLIDDFDLIVNHADSDKNNIKFYLNHDECRIQYCLTIDKERTEGYCISCLEKSDCTFIVGKNKFIGAKFLFDNPPVFWLDNMSAVIGGCMVVRSREVASESLFKIDKVFTEDWGGVNIRKESQGDGKHEDSIQRKMILEELSRGASVIFDDDGSGEAADIVSIYEEEERILVRLIHCKYSSEDNPGLRITELYELCCQAQKSVKWAGSFKKLVRHLKKREEIRLTNERPSRFENGEIIDLSRFLKMSERLPISYECVLVQPGISRRKLSEENDSARNFFRLLASTQMYLSDTYNINMNLITSD